MHKFITAAVALTVLSACDSEGIDRPDLEDTPPPATPDITLPLNDGSETVIGEGTSDGDTTTMINVDGGSSTSDGGESATNVDGGSSTSDGGESAANVDGGSSTSDGGESVSNVDGGSSTSDGGVILDDGQNAEPVVQNVRDTDAGSFSSDATGGNVIRRSSLTATGMENICTVASNPNDSLTPASVISFCTTTHGVHSVPSLVTSGNNASPPTPTVQ